MEKKVTEHAAAHEHDEPPPAPVPRDPDLPTVSDTTLIFFAAGSLFVTAVALFVLLD
jgi:hypothetical protein